MKRTLQVIGLISGIALLFVNAAEACGDKLLALSRAVRFQRAYAAARPANILMYANRSLPSTPVMEPRLHATLKQAGHKLRMVETGGEIELALRSGQYDLVLADVADAAMLKQRAESAPSQPLVLPVFQKPTKKELSAAEKQYGFYVLGPEKPIESLVAIDLAMKFRSSRPGRPS